MAERAGPAFSLVVIADAHVHDIEGDYGIPGIAVGERRLSLQTWAHSRESTRVYNESSLAFEAALDVVASRGIRHVVLLGDYTDDGQRRTTESLAKRLWEHEARFGTRFYALPGNHDIFGPAGRHQSRHFLVPDGGSVRVSSDDRDPPSGSVVTPVMFCEGYPAGLMPMARYGYFRRPDDLSWETPFGHDDSPEARTYEVASEDGTNRYQLMDASYLVEPEPGLWLLMIDANVFEPRNGSFRRGSKSAFIDSSGAGWNALLRLKPFLIDWIADVAARAQASGKTLLPFSHYPTIDPFDDREGYEQALFPDGVISLRRPKDEVAEALISAGLKLHFSGHWHIDGVSRHQHLDKTLTNIALPSLVAFPPAFKHLSVETGCLTVETIDLSTLPLDGDVMALYRREAERNGLVPDEALQAIDYGDFLRCHAKALVAHRYFRREWPQDVIRIIATMSVADLLCDPRTAPQHHRAASLLVANAFSDLSVLDLIADWYCLRQAGSMALSLIGQQRLDHMRRIAGPYADPPSASDEIQTHPVVAYLEIFFRSMQFYVDRAEQLDGMNQFDL
ncbi:MAG: metallophosphoesterase [Rhizobium sp.]|nr:metallophosphoesterase [Rhizobium sp.]